MVSTLASRHSLKLLAILLSMVILIDNNSMVDAKDKGQDIIIYNGKVILKGGKKKGNIIISNGDEVHNQGKYKHKKKYMNYGGFW